MGLVGYGMAGRLVHTPLIKAAGLRVAVVATRDPERAAQARTDNPGVEIVDDHRALLARDDVAAVVLASPTGAHAAQALATLPALALAVDPPEDDLMRRPPRNPKTGIFTRPVACLAREIEFLT